MVKFGAGWKIARQQVCNRSHHIKLTQYTNGDTRAHTHTIQQWPLSLLKLIFIESADFRFQQFKLWIFGLSFLFGCEMRDARYAIRAQFTCLEKCMRHKTINSSPFIAVQRFLVYCP